MGTIIELQSIDHVLLKLRRSRLRARTTTSVAFTALYRHFASTFIRRLASTIINILAFAIWALGIGGSELHRSRADMYLYVYEIRVSPYGYRLTGGHLKTQSPHTQYFHTLCSLRSPRALARSRFAPVLACAQLTSLAARWPPRLLLASFALPAGSRCSPPRLLLSLRSCSGLLPRACPLLCARHAFCSLRSPACLLLAALALPAARSSLLRLLRSPPRQLLSLRSCFACCLPASRLSLALRAPCLLLASLAASPAARCARLACCLLLTAAPAPLTASPAALASLAASPAAARFARRLTYSPA